MKKFNSFLAVLLIIAFVLPCFPIMVSAAELSYEKTGTVYTINGTPYYQSRTKAEYNGVVAGTLFWVDASNAIIVDRDTIAKLSLVKMYNDAIKLDPSFISTYNAAMHDEAASLYFKMITNSDWFDRFGTWVGNLIGNAPKGPLGALTDFSISLATDAISVDTIAEVTYTELLRYYSNNTSAYAELVRKALSSGTYTEYNTINAAVWYKIHSDASWETFMSLAGDDILEIQNQNDFEKFCQNVLKGIIDSVVPPISDNELANYILDGAISLMEFGEKTGSSKTFQNSVDEKLASTEYNVDYDLVDKHVETAKKLTKQNSSTPSASYSTGTYKPSDTSGLNIRSGASTSYSVVGAITYSTNFVVTAVNGNWGKTTCNGISGWVCLDYATYLSSGGSTVKDVTGFVAYVKGRVGESFTSNACQAFVWQTVYRFFNKDGNACCATKAWQQWGKSSSKSNIPLGAAVYFGGAGVTDSVCGQDAGHSSIYVGNNMIVHAWSGKIVSTTIDYVINCGYTYRGWGWQANYAIPQASSYAVDVNGYVDSEYKSSLNGYVTFDVYINGALAKSGVGDFNTSYPDGTRYEVKNIVPAAGYKIASTDGLSGTVNGKIAYATIRLATDKKESKIPDGWVAEIPSGAASENYKSKTFYRYRDKTETPVYGDWSANKTSSSPVTASETLRLISTTTYYNYYHYCCQSYEGCLNVDSIKYGTGSVYHTLRTTTALTKANVADKGGKTLYGGESKWACAKNFYVWAQASPFNTYEYTYQTRTKSINITYTNWSDWSETYPSTASNREIESKTFYKYEPATYKISYSANGGTGAPATQTKTYGITLTLSTAVPTRNGYTFKGWSTSANGSVAYQSGASYTANAAVTLYAVWEKNPAIVGGIITVGNAVGAPGETVTVTVTISDNPGLTMMVLSPDYNSNYLELLNVENGDVFEGITVGQRILLDAGNIDTTLNGTLIKLKFKIKDNVPSGSYAVSLIANEAIDLNYGDHTLASNAGTLTVARKYVVSFNSNGGTGAPASQTKTENVALTLSSTKPTRSGYTFKGWATSANGSVAYQPGASYTANAAVTLYAVWEKIPAKYSVNFNANGGTGAPATQTKTENIALTLSSTKPTRNGYTFKGWATSANGSVAYQPGSSYTANAAVTLYAIWEKIPAKYSVNFNANGGTGAPAAQTKTENVALTLSSTKPTRSGYTFQGWATSANGSVAYQPGASYTANSAVTLYAIWEKIPAKYSVNFNANGGTGAPAAQTKTENVALTLSSTKPTRSGYTFKGWATSANGSVAYQPGASYTANAAVTLYAIWEKNATVSGATITVGSVSAAPGSTVSIAVKLDKNPGVALISLTAKYDTSALELIDTKNGKIFNDFTSQRNMLFLSETDIKNDGVLVTLTFRVKDNTKSGDYAINLTCNEAYNSNGGDVNFAVNAGVLTVAAYKYGDANGDGKIDGKDVILLKKYMANYVYETNTSTVDVELGADANGDGKIDGKDVILLKKYMANYVYETNSSTVVLGPQK